MAPLVVRLPPVKQGISIDREPARPVEGEHTQTSIGAMPAQRFERSEHGKLKAFISYSRDDLDFADQLDIALRLLGFETSLDRHAISGAEEWRQRLATLIREADTIVFVLSPSSANSDICAWEVKEATRLRKPAVHSSGLPRCRRSASTAAAARSQLYLLLSRAKVSWLRRANSDCLLLAFRRATIPNAAAIALAK